MASGDSDPGIFALIGEKLLGHVWRPTEDKLVFTVPVTLSTSRGKGPKVVETLTAEDIPRLPSMVFTKRMLLGFVMSLYDPMGLISPLTVVLKIKLRGL